MAEEYHIMKWTTKYYQTVRILPKYNRKIVETDTHFPSLLQTIQ